MFDTVLRCNLAAIAASTFVADTSSRTKLRTLLNLRRLEEISDDAVWAALADTAVQRKVHARSSLFNIGDPARNYFLVQSGRLLVYRQSSSAKPAIRVVTDGDLFTYDCGGTRAANCEALDDCAVVCIDRQRLHESARSSSLLTRVLRAVHSAELEMILESLGESRAGRAPRASENDDCSVVQNLRFRPPGASRATQRSFSENWSATVLRPDFSSRSNKSGVKS